MKTAEKWLEMCDKRNVPPENIETHLAILRQIQLDAFKSGMKEAAEVIENEGTRFGMAETYKQAILTAAEKKTNV